MRMVVIPEEVYLSLVNQNKSLANPLDSYIVEATNRMNNILQDPTLDDSRKFQLYSNELKRVQKVRADRAEMPTNVNIKNVAPDLLTSTVNEISTAVAEKVNTPYHEISESKRSTKSSIPNSDVSTPSVNGESHEYDSTIEKSQKDQRAQFPTSPRVERKKNFEKLRNYLNNNRQKFGIREDGRIFKDAKKHEVYTYSNFETAARALTGLTPKRPHGMMQLMDAIKLDENIKPLILNFESPQKGKGKRKIVISEDIVSIKKSHPNRCPAQEENNSQHLKQVRFCPEMWY